MRRTWQYEDGILEVTGEEIVKRANSVGTKQLYVKEGWGPPGEGEAQGYIVSCTVHKRGVVQQYLQSRHGTHAVTWFFSNRLLTLPTPSLEQYRQHVVAGILVKLPAYDGLTDDFARQLLLYGLCRDHYHVGPVHDPTLFPDSVPSCAVLVAVILHHFSWESNNTAAHDTESKVEELYATSAKRFVREYKEHCRRKQVTLAFVLDSYRSGFPLPSVVLAHLHENCIDFDWTAMPFQLLIVHQLLHDEITQKYPPSLERMTLYLKTLTDAIEFNNQEVQEELLLKRCQCTESLLRSSHSPSTLPSGYTTLKYGTNEKDIITLLMNSGINNNDGLTAWKAGYLMAEFILHQPHIFEGKRCLELGSGTGITGVILARHAKPASVLLTDYDHLILDNLTKNLEINHIKVTGTPDSPFVPPPAYDDTKQEEREPSVFVRRLDWSSPDLQLIEQFRPEIIFSCDTVYLPEMLGPLTSVFQYCLQERSNSNNNNSESNSESKNSKSGDENTTTMHGAFGNLLHWLVKPTSCGRSTPPSSPKSSPSSAPLPAPSSPLSPTSKSTPGSPQQQPQQPLLSPVYPMVLSMQTKRNEQTFASYVRHVLSRNLILRTVPILALPQLFSYPRTTETCELHKITDESII